MKRSGVLHILLSAFGFGLMPILALYVYRSGMGVVTMLFLRFGAAALLLALWRRAWLREIPAAALPGLLLMGACYALQSLSYLTAVTFIPVSLASLILYVYPALVCLLALLIDRERVRRETAAALALSFLGLALVLGVGFGAVDLRGVLLASAAAVVYSCYIIVSNRMLRRVSPPEAMTVVSAASALLFLAGGLAGRALGFGFRPAALAPLAGIVLFCTLGAILSFFRGLGILGPNRSAVLSMSEPLFTILMSAALFGERLTALQAAGGALLLAGVLLVTLTRRKTAGNA